MAVLRHLSKHRQATLAKVTILLRPTAISSSDPKRQEQLAEIKKLGVDLLSGDIVASTLDELSKLFKPFHTIISCTGFVAGRSTQFKIAEAALSAGVKRYFPWQFGVDYDTIGRGSAQDLFDEQLDVRDLLRSQEPGGTEWVIISTGMFTSFLFEQSFGVVDLAQNTVHALGGWDNTVTVTSSEDIGLLTAEIVFAEPRVANTIVFVAGDTVTYSQLADIVELVLDQTMKKEEWSVEMLKKELTQDSDNPIKKYRVVFAEGKGVSWDVAATFNARKGMKIENIEEWARKHII